MAFNEILNKLLHEIQKKKPFNFDIVFKENSEFKKQNILLQVKFEALSMEENYATYGGMQFRTLFRRILGRSIESMRGMKGCTNTRFLKWKKLCHHLSMSQRLQIKKKTKVIQMGKDHQVQEQHKSQETLEEERIALRGRLLNRLSNK